MATKKTTRPTMVDVAKRAGVSQMTVSRAINGKGYVSDDVRERIEAAANEIGYVRNLLAHGLRSEKTNLLAVVVPSLGNTVFTDVLTGITDTVTDQGFSPVFGVTEYSVEREEQLVKNLLSWQPFGIVLAGMEHSDATRAAIRGSGIRVVEIMDIDGDPMSITFGFSHRLAGEKTAEHMLSKGHRTFAYVGSQGGRDLRAVKRFEGFKAVLASKGAKLITTELGQGSSSMSEGLRMTEAILKNKETPDAIYYANDDLAGGGLMYCLANGIRMPEDIALAGFNGLPFLDSFPVQLTTVRTPRYDIGRQAGTYLVEAEQQNSTEEQRTVDLGFEFIAGDTT